MRLKQLLVATTSAIVITSFSSVAFAGAVTSKEEIAISTTGGGIKVKSDNGNTFNLGGRIMYDYDYFDGAYNSDFTDDRLGNGSSETEFRRTRLEMSGTVANDWGYNLTIDVDEGDAEIQTGFITYTGFSFADILLGRFKVPFGLEELTSSKWTTTIERSPITDFGFLTRQPSFQLALQGRTESLFWGASISDEDNEDDDGQDAYSLAGRIGGHFPVAENSFIHLAASYAVRDFGDSGALDFSSNLGVHTAEDITVAGGTEFGVDDADQFGLEAAGVFGPFILQGEYRSVDFDENDDLANASDVDVDGYYIQASYILTGESRVYKSGLGFFDKVKPKGPLGAWELVAKYEDSEIDVDIVGDKAEYSILTLGANWYANNNVKLSLNYLDTDTDNFTSAAGDSLDAAGESDGEAVSFRVQYAF